MALTPDPPNKIIALFKRPYLTGPFPNRPLTWCKERRCDITIGPTTAENADAVVVPMRHLEETISNFEKFRQSSQRWVFLQYESPEYNFKSYTHLNGFFNETMTYRLDSTIPFPYDTFYAVTRMIQQEQLNKVKKIGGMVDGIKSVGN